MTQLVFSYEGPAPFPQTVVTCTGIVQGERDTAITLGTCKARKEPHIDPTPEKSSTANKSCGETNGAKKMSNWDKAKNSLFDDSQPDIRLLSGTHHSSLKFHYI